MGIATFKKILAVAALAGLLAGLLLTAVQQIQVIPHILEAETYEQAAGTLPRTGPADVPAEHSHGAWHPGNGWERNLYTAAANIVVAFGFALLLGAAAEWRGTKLDWRSGLLWGAAGYAVFFVSPSLGLPPELPGTQAAELAHRQLWWTATSVGTAAGLALIVFSGRHAAKILGVVLLIVPHLVGAPHPAVHGGSAPAELAQTFILATIIANAVFWLALGALYGFFYRRLAD